MRLLTVLVFCALTGSALAQDPEDKLVRACALLILPQPEHPVKILSRERVHRMVTITFEFSGVERLPVVLECQFLNDTSEVPELAAAAMDGYAMGAEDLAGMNKFIWDNWSR